MSLTKKSQTQKGVKPISTAKLDKLWRDKVYAQGKHKCEYCGKVQVNAHHIFSRSNYAVRWDVDNGVCVCVSHHVFGNLSFHKAPAEMLEWIKEKRGNEWYDRLRAKARVKQDINISKELAENNLK
jgi:5-methylcytosine-specific restriction endonuclease McrA